MSQLLFDRAALIFLVLAWIAGPVLSFGIALAFAHARWPALNDRRSIEYAQNMAVIGCVPFLGLFIVALFHDFGRQGLLFATPKATA